MGIRRHDRLRHLAAGIAVASLLVPSAQARVAEDTGVGKGGQPPVAYDGSDYQNRGSIGNLWADYDGSRYYHVIGASRGETKGSSALDDRYGYVHGTGVPIGQQNQPVLPDDRANRLTPAAGDPQVVSAPSAGFDWRDAGIGAGLGIGLMLLAFAAALATQHVDRKTVAGA